MNDVFFLSGRWAGVKARFWHLVLAVCSSRCQPVWTSSLCNTSSMRRWGGQGGEGGAAILYQRSTWARTKRSSMSPPSPPPATRSCQPPLPPSWSQWRRPELRANGGPPHSPYSKASRSSDSRWYDPLHHLHWHSQRHSHHHYYALMRIIWGFSPFCAPISMCSSNDFLNVTEQRTSGLSSVT